VGVRVGGGVRCAWGSAGASEERAACERYPRELRATSQSDYPLRLAAAEDTGSFGTRFGPEGAKESVQAGSCGAARRLRHPCLFSPSVPAQPILGMARRLLYSSQ